MTTTQRKSAPLAQEEWFLTFGDATAYVFYRSFDRHTFAPSKEGLAACRQTVSYRNIRV